MPDVAVIIVAAGRGVRAGGDLPKQFLQIGGEIMLRRTLSMFVEAENVGRVLPVIHPEDIALFQAAAANMTMLTPAFGGATRQASVRAGLEALSARPPDIVLIHDAARPFATRELIAREMCIRDSVTSMRRTFGDINAKRAGLIACCLSAPMT